MNQREKFSSRLGFILISAGCAIGLGNVYRFPIITGAYGGGLFVLIYIAFLIILGLPVMCAELAVGRASQRSIASSFDALEKKGQKWHLMKYVGIAGNYLLMMFYTTIAGWMLLYFGKYLTGSITTIESIADLGTHFGETVSNVWLILGGTVFTILACFLVCSLGLQKGVERITKYMMMLLFLLIVGLAVYCCTLDGAVEGLKFYLIPSVDKIADSGIVTTISAAMGQSFFTLSTGIGSIAIFGSYIGKDRSLLGEAVTITTLDTFIALTSGLIIFPAYFTFTNGAALGESSASAKFLFTTLSSIFNTMPGGRLIGCLFFLFMIFAAYSTVIAVFENIMSFWLELTNLSRRKIAAINIVLLIVLALPAVFSVNIWSDITVLGLGFLDLEDKIVSNLLLPLGSIVYILFCTTRYGWGWDNFYSEVNTGNGLKLPRWIRPYMTFVLPVIVIAVMVLSFI
ncbi:MAG: sodium-dependent transporter [Ruminococcaceae bacterium]|nr:sodium-dependent transporter [Oscillospiraceae bacterium]